MQGYSWNGEWQGPYGASNEDEGWSSYPNQHQNYEHQGPPNYYQPSYGGEQQQWSDFGQGAMPSWAAHQSLPSFYPDSPSTNYHQDSPSTYFHQDYNQDHPPFQDQCSRPDYSNQSSPSMHEQLLMLLEVSRRQLQTSEEQSLRLTRLVEEPLLPPQLEEVEMNDRDLGMTFEEMDEEVEAPSITKDQPTMHDDKVEGFEEEDDSSYEDHLLEWYLGLEMYARPNGKEGESTIYLEDFSIPKDKYIDLDVGVEEFERDDDGEWKEEVHEDLKPSKFDIAPPIEKPMVWCFPRVVVPMRPNETLQDSCLVLKYLCEETHKKYFPHKSRMDSSISRPPLDNLIDRPSTTISLGSIVELDVHSPTYLYPLQAYTSTRRKPQQGKSCHAQPLQLLHLSLRVLLGIQLQSLKKLMEFKEVLSWGA